MLTLTASGSVSDYSDTTSLQQSVATAAGVDRSLVAISVAADSVIITATIAVPASTTAAALQASLASKLATAATASTVLGVSLEAAPTVAISSPAARGDPSGDPDTLIDLPEEGGEAGLTLAATGGIAGGGGALLLLLAVGGTVLCRRRVRRRGAVAKGLRGGHGKPAATTSGSDDQVPIAVRGSFDKINNILKPAKLPAPPELPPIKAVIHQTGLTMHDRLDAKEPPPLAAEWVTVAASSGSHSKQASTSVGSQPLFPPAAKEGEPSPLPMSNRVWLGNPRGQREEEVDKAPAETRSTCSDYV